MANGITTSSTLASMGFVVSPRAKEPLAKYLLWYADVGISHRVQKKQAKVSKYYIIS